MLKNKAKIFMASSVLLGSLAIGAVMVNADTTTSATTSGKPNFMSGLVTAISQKFNLNQSDVQAVFDTQEAQMRADMEAKGKVMQDQRLAQAVTDGKLTQAQSNLVKAKTAEIKTQMDNLKVTLKDKTPEERMAAMKTTMDNVKTWATQNNIPLEFIRMGGPHGGRHGRGGFGKMNPNNAPQTTTTSVQ